MGILHAIWRKQEASISSKLKKKKNRQSNGEVSGINKMGEALLQDHFMIRPIQTT